VLLSNSVHTPHTPPPVMPAAGWVLAPVSVPRVHGPRHGAGRRLIGAPHSGRRHPPIATPPHGGRRTLPRSPPARPGAKVTLRPRPGARKRSFRPPITLNGRGHLATRKPATQLRHPAGSPHTPRL